MEFKIFYGVPPAQNGNAAAYAVTQQQSGDAVNNGNEYCAGLTARASVHV